MHRPSRGAKAAGVAWLIDMTWGVRNFLNFTFSALLRPLFGWLLLREVGRRRPAPPRALPGHAFEPMLYGVGLALILCFVLKETGPAAHAAPSTRLESP